MSVLDQSLRSARSVLVAPPPGEARAAGQGMPPPHGSAKRVAAVVGRGVPSMRLGHACRRCQRCRGVPPPAHSLSARFKATGRPTSPIVAASVPHQHLFASSDGLSDVLIPLRV